MNHKKIISFGLLVVGAVLALCVVYFGTFDRFWLNTLQAVSAVFILGVCLLLIRYFFGADRNISQRGRHLWFMLGCCVLAWFIVKVIAFGAIVDR
jgi:uncharacterized membrane protein